MARISVIAYPLTRDNPRPKDANMPSPMEVWLGRNIWQGQEASIIYCFLISKYRLTVFRTQTITMATKTTIRTKGMAIIRMVREYT